MLGENFRLKRDPFSIPTTGLGEKRSDYVGRLILAPNRYLELIHRFRIDKATLSLQPQRGHRARRAG